MKIIHFDDFRALVAQTNFNACVSPVAQSNDFVYLPGPKWLFSIFIRCCYIQNVQILSTPCQRTDLRHIFEEYFSYHCSCSVRFQFKDFQLHVLSIFHFILSPLPRVKLNNSISTKCCQIKISINVVCHAI